MAQKPCPAANLAECGVVQRTRIVLVIVRQKLSLVAGHVDPDGAIALASFAGKAKVKRRLNIFVAPLAGDRSPQGHFPEQVGAAASGMLFLASYAEAWAH